MSSAKDGSNSYRQMLLPPRHRSHRSHGRFTRSYGHLKNEQRQTRSLGPPPGMTNQEWRLVKVERFFNFLVQQKGENVRGIPHLYISAHDNTYYMYCFMKIIHALVPLFDNAKGFIKGHETGRCAHINIKLLHFFIAKTITVYMFKVKLCSHYFPVALRLQCLLAFFFWGD